MDKVTIDDFKSMSCIGYRGYDDEWYPNSDYMKYIKLGNHHYQVYITKIKKNWWKLRIYLCLTASNSQDILVLSMHAHTMKQLTQYAVEAINKYNDSEECIRDIEEWKKVNSKPVFDKDFNYLGITYTTPDRERDNSEFDYYNDEKPKISYGVYYTLEKESVMVCEITSCSSTTYWDKSEELRSKILESCNQQVNKGKVITVI